MSLCAIKSRLKDVSNKLKNKLYTCYKLSSKTHFSCQTKECSSDKTRARFFSFKQGFWKKNAHNSRKLTRQKSINTYTKSIYYSSTSKRKRKRDQNGSVKKCSSFQHSSKLQQHRENIDLSSDSHLPFGYSVICSIALY